MQADGGARAEPLRALIARYYGDECRILTTRRTGGERAFLFVVEAMLRGRQLRLLGTVGRTREVMEHSAMDPLAPERLVFPYERMMLASLALVEEPDDILLLGLGGGAMSRHLDAYLPDAEITVVERDPAVIAIAREHFLIRRKITRADAVEVVAEKRRAFDAILVDLYDASGAAPLPETFWQDCVAALKPGGAIAINWAGGWTGSELTGTSRQRVARVMPQLPGSFLVSERGPRGNIVQFVPGAAGLRASGLATRLAAFGERFKLPREDRDILQRCDTGVRYPARRQSGTLKAKPKPRAKAKTGGRSAR
jgi:predicted O-methyltransferase YrrM